MGLAVAAAFAALAPGCAVDRERERPIDCPTWRTEVSAVLLERCAGCHSGPEPDGAYDLTTYLGALGGGTDAISNAIAGDASSRLLATLSPESIDEVHAPHAEVRDLLETWVVLCSVDYGSAIHPPGILDSSSAAFHATALARDGWPLESCTRCHGDDFGGGPADAPCTTCHTEGPTACITCHADLLAEGSHAAHLPAPLGPDDFADASLCAGCHAVPTQWDEAGHLRVAPGQSDPPPAEVMLAGLAAHRPARTPDPGPPAWDPVRRTCTNVYCHGGAFRLDDGSLDPAATLTVPEWSRPGEGQAECGTCHGLPPATHPDDPTCARCHGVVVDAEGAFIDTARHVDGIVDVGEGCSGCHGSPDTAAPPRDTLGRTDSGLLTVGAHRAHVLATSRLAAPIPCDECHIDPDDRDDVGHIDSPAPAEVFGAAPMRIASAGGASPAWDRATGTCANVYCHGGGPVFADDMAPGRTLTPRWTAVGLGAPGKAVCGACHGIPPLDGTHDPAAILADCADCHPTPPDRHIDGVVDVR